jgi:hypothetical protein
MPCSCDGLDERSGFHTGAHGAGGSSLLKRQAAESLTWDIGEILEQAPAREKMAARRDLRKWLEGRGHDMARFDALAEGKRVV